MSRFEELQQAYDTYKAKKTAYEDESYRFAAEIFHGLVVYSGCPEKNIEWFPPSQDFDADAANRTFYTQAGAMEIADDGFWRLGLAFLLTPKRAVLQYILNFKKHTDKFVLKLEGFEKQFEIPKANEDALVPFFDFMIAVAMENYRDGLKNFVEQDTRKPIGFVAKARKERASTSA